MKRVTINLPEDLIAAIKDYQKTNNLQSFSAAIAELAAKQLGRKAGIKKWGGKRDQK